MDASIPAFRTFLSTFGSLDQLYVVFTAPEGYPIADYGDRIDAWIDQLRAAPEIDRVDAGVADRIAQCRLARGPPAAAARRRHAGRSARPASSEGTQRGGREQHASS